MQVGDIVHSHAYIVHMGLCLLLTPNGQVAVVWSAHRIWDRVVLPLPRNNRPSTVNYRQACERRPDCSPNFVLNDSECT